MRLNKCWPVLKRYEGACLRRLAMPLGGIGTGTVSLGGRGDLRDWEIMNRPAKKFSPRQSFFALRTETAGREPVVRALEGLIDPADFEGASGCPVPNHGLPRFRDCSFHVAYPLAQVLLSDPDVPVKVRIEAFNPLIPVDADASGIPAAVIRFVLENKTRKRTQISLCGNIENFIGFDGTEGKALRNVNRFRRDAGQAGLFLVSEGVDPRAEAWGSLALALLDAKDVTYRLAWSNTGPGEALLDFWDDFLSDGRLETRRPDRQQNNPQGSISANLVLAPNKEGTVTFLLAWHFPNRRTWTPGANRNQVGNYYATRYNDAWDVVRKTAPQLRWLERKTALFVRSFCSSSLPNVIKEAALFNLSTLRTQTVFRTQDGRIFGWEGCGDRKGCCHGSCTHVWNYEQATAFLFGDLARRMREVEFLQATDDRGLMSFRTNLPLKRAGEYGFAAADGQLGCLMKLYRDWQLSGDDAMLRKLWPRARKALEFCWMPGGWDGDGDGIMEGCQHNTMDVEYYGPNPQMGGWYLGALRAMEEMAQYLGEQALADKCRRLFGNGRRWIDANLFNGEYYEHSIRPPGKKTDVGNGLSLNPDRTAQALVGEPRFQLGAGCLVDQLVGQLMAHVCGLGYLLDPRHVKKTLRAIMKYNFKRNLFGHFNHNRTYALQDEPALLMAAYPSRRPEIPFPYYGEAMTGFEYTAAIGMLYEKLMVDGLRCMAAIRSRHDGRRRNPFDEAECGHHYARAMVSWAAIPALTGFQYNGISKTLEFSCLDGRFFWANGYAWGVCRQKRTGDRIDVDLKILGGTLELLSFVLKKTGRVNFRKRRRIPEGRSIHIVISTQRYADA